MGNTCVERGLARAHNRRPIQERHRQNIASNNGWQPGPACLSHPEPSGGSPGLRRVPEPQGRRKVYHRRRFQGRTAKRMELEAAVPYRLRTCRCTLFTAGFESPLSCTLRCALLQARQVGDPTCLTCVDLSQRIRTSDHAASRPSEETAFESLEASITAV